MEQSEGASHLLVVYGLSTAQTHTHTHQCTQTHTWLRYCQVHTTVIQHLLPFIALCSLFMFLCIPPSWCVWFLSIHSFAFWSLSIILSKYHSFIHSPSLPLVYQSICLSVHPHVILLFRQSSIHLSVTQNRCLEVHVNWERKRHLCVCSCAFSMSVYVSEGVCICVCEQRLNAD